MEVRHNFVSCVEPMMGQRDVIVIGETGFAFEPEFPRHLARLAAAAANGGSPDLPCSTEAAALCVRRTCGVPFHRTKN